VALNCGMGSSSLNAEVNAFERLQRGTEGGVDLPWIKVQNVGAVSGAVFVVFADTEANLCETIG
jgi:hypothetical protein